MPVPTTDEEFDVFLSYNSKDRQAVIDIGNQLKARGIKPWIDVWEITPFTRWQDELQRVIPYIKAVAVFVGPSGIGPWEDIEINAFLEEFAKRKIHMGLVLLPGCVDKPDVPIFLKSFQAVDYRISNPNPIEQLVWGISGRKQMPLLLDKILKLNFDEQINFVKSKIKDYQVASFLIHGPPEYGQRVLLTRLIRIISHGRQNIKSIKINLGNNMGMGRETIWRLIANEFGSLVEVNAPSFYVEIADQICERWQTQDVIFIFHTVDYILPELLKDLIEKFWQTLAEKALNNLQQVKNDTYLLMFLVDYKGCVCNWDVWNFNQSNAPDYPFTLPPIAPLQPNILENWINQIADDVLPSGLTKQDLINDQLKGYIPYEVYSRICKYCGNTWEGEIQKWLA